MSVDEEVLKREFSRNIGNDVRVTYDVGTASSPHHVTQRGILKYYLDDPSSIDKVCLIVPGKIRDGASSERVQHLSCTVLHYENIVSVTPVTNESKKI